MYGEREADLFYIIIKGTVSIQIPNNEITEFDFKRRDFKKLIQWR